jgi:spore germination protein YaaH
MATLRGWASRVVGLSAILAGLAWNTPASAASSATVFGYLPYWELSQVAATPPRYESLTHIACFSVEVNADGTLGDLHGWPGDWASVIDAARANGVKIVLVATNMSASSIYTLITTPANKSRFFANIRAQVLAGHADGLNIDFEDDMSNSPPWRSYINGFLADLTAYMHAQVPGCEVSFASPVVNWWASTWDFASLAASCDYLFVMGYDFYGSWSDTSGPSAPLTGGYFNITRSITVDYAAVDPDKIILGVPYYGNEWTTVTADPYSTRLAWVRSVAFASEQSATYGLQWDSVTQTPWYRWYDGKNWHQVWFDNAQSLKLL